MNACPGWSWDVGQPPRRQLKLCSGQNHQIISIGTGNHVYYFMGLSRNNGENTFMDRRQSLRERIGEVGVANATTSTSG